MRGGFALHIIVQFWTNFGTKGGVVMCSDV
jgi:hypothetical protein